MSKPTTDMLVWVSNNRGALSEVAEEVGVSPQFVHLVLRGERRNARVANLLRKRGAPVPDPDYKPETAPV